MKTGSRKLIFCLLLATAFFGMACAKEATQDSEAPSSGLVIEKPAEFNRVGAAIPGLACEGILDGNSPAPIPLTLNSADNTCSGTLPDITAGDHQFTLRYFVLYGSTPVKLILAHQTKTVTVTSGQSISLSFLKAGYTYPDTDGDGYNDLFEVANVAKGYNPTRYCLDHDLDGYPDPACGGADCDDGDTFNWISCAACLDQDHDGWFAGCDSYGGGVSRKGPDCDDHADGIWQGCTVYPRPPKKISNAYSKKTFGGFRMNENQIYWTDNRNGGIEDIYWTVITPEGNTVMPESRIMAPLGPRRTSLSVGRDAICYESNQSGISEIYRSDQTGSNEQRITYSPAPPPFSGDGDTLPKSSPSLITDSQAVFFMKMPSAFGALRSIWVSLDSPSGPTIGSASFLTDIESIGKVAGGDSNSAIGFTRLNGYISAYILSQGYEILLDSTPSSGGRSAPALAWSGSEYGVVWQDNRDQASEIYFCRMSTNGQKLGPDIRLSYDDHISTAPDIDWAMIPPEGREYGVVWVDDRMVGDREGDFYPYFARISADGKILGSGVKISNIHATQARISWLNSQSGSGFTHYYRVLTHYYDEYSSSAMRQDIYFIRIDLSP